MANQYRFILGKKVDTTTNLVTNGTFTGSAAGWTLGAMCYYNLNAVWVDSSLGAGGTADQTLSQAGIITPNNFYYLQYQFNTRTLGGFTGARLSHSLGGAYVDYMNDYQELTGAGTYYHYYQFAPKGNDLTFIFRGVPPNSTTKPACSIDNVVLYPYVWNDPLSYDPTNWDNAKITKKRDEVLNGLIINYIQDLTFIEDGYDYLYAQYLANGFCGEIPIRIEKIDSSGNYQLFHEGIIFINDAKFNLTKKEVTVTIEDQNASLVFIKGKNVRTWIQEFNTYGPVVSVDPQVPIDFNDNAGNYVTYANKVCFDISLLIQRLIVFGSRYRVDGGSAYFSTGAFADACIGMVISLTGGGGTGEIYKMSINELFTELDKIFNLSFSITTNADGVPKIMIEDKASYLNASPVLTLNYVNDLQMEFDKSNFIKTLNIGYEHVDATATTKNLDTPLGEQYFTTNICTGKTLNLVSKFIQDSTIIKALLGFGATPITNDKYDNEYFIITTNGAQTDNDGAASYNYNQWLSTESNVVRWLATLQLSLTKGGTNGTIIAKANTTLDKIYSFNFPLTKAQFDLIVQAYNTIDFNMGSDGSTKISGYLLEANHEIKTGITQFKLLA